MRGRGWGEERKRGGEVKRGREFYEILLLRMN